MDKATQIAVMNEWRRLQREYPDLEGWRLGYKPRYKATLGLCRYRTRQLFLATWLDEAQAIDTLRHEAAHALAGPGAKHGPRWKAWAVRLGTRPRACCRAPENAPEREQPRWEVYCPACDRVLGKRRRRSSRPRMHSYCRTVVEFRRIG